MADVLVTTRLDDQISGKLGRIAKETGNIAGTSGRIDRLTSSFRGLGGVLGTLGALSLGREFLRLSDEATRISSRLKLATDTTEQFAKAQERLFRISQETSTRFATNVELFQKLERSTRTLGLSQDQLFTITERLSKAVAISGSSAESANAAIVQLTQGLASGQLRGQELNSVLEQATPILETLAQNLNIPIGKFRELAEQGFFTAEVVAKGLLAQGEGTKALERDFAQLSLTSEKAFTQLSNALLKVTGVFEEASGTGSAFSSVVVSLAVALEKLAPFLVELVENTSRGIKAMVEFSQAFVDVEKRALESTQSLFSGLSDHLGGRLSALIEGAKAKVGELTEKFREMYEDVVGGSYVPEMLASIEREFRSLDRVMVEPAERAIRRVDASFRDLGGSVVGSASSAVAGIANAFSGLVRFVGDISQIGRVFGIGGRGLSDAGSFIGGIGQLLSLGGSLFSGGSGASTDGLLRGFGGASGGLSLLSLATGFTSPTLGTLFSGAGSALGLGTGAVAGLGNAGLFAPYGIIGSLLGNLLGFKGTGATIGGAVGGLAGGAAAGAISGTALGASLGAFAGPIGAALGALLGTVLGGLFKSTPPRGHAVRDFDAFGGSFVSETFAKKGGDVGAVLGPLSGIADTFAAVAKSLGVSLAGFRIGIGFSGNQQRFIGTGIPGSDFTEANFEQVAAAVLASQIGRASESGVGDPFLHREFFRASGVGATLTQQIAAIQQAQAAIAEFNQTLTEVEKTVSGTRTPLTDLGAQFDGLRAQALALSRDSATLQRIEAARALAIQNLQKVVLDQIAAIEQQLSGAYTTLADINAQFNALIAEGFAVGLDSATMDRLGLAHMRAIEAAQAAFIDQLIALDHQLSGTLDPFAAFNAQMADLHRQADGLQLDFMHPRIEELWADQFTKAIDDLAISAGLATADPFKEINAMIDAFIKQARFMEADQSVFQRLEQIRAALLGQKEQELAQLEQEVRLRSTLLGLIGPGGSIFSPEGGFQGFLGPGGEIIRSGALIGPGGEIIQGFQHGGDAVFTRPTPILVGESGPEAVSVTPLSRGGRRNGREINVNFNGVTVLDDISAGQLTRILDREFAKRELRFG